jgi:hypothetical protein
MLPDPGFLGLASGEFGRETGRRGEVVRLGMSAREVAAAEVEIGPPVAPAHVEDVQSLEDLHSPPPITGTTSSSSGHVGGPESSDSLSHSKRAARRYATRSRFDQGGAGDGIRTRDIQLGRLALYQLSYSRPCGAIVPDDDVRVG